ncbi:hypothetical protein SUNI508_02049 [Seiridium unicorne]|uniref:Uncharacterized protein n=1 Tax=Seiridium unicorne TaxID=138068 RepID=A0ABR2UKV9_9PEZI
MKIILRIPPSLSSYSLADVVKPFKAPLPMKPPAECIDRNDTICASFFHYLLEIRMNSLNVVTHCRVSWCSRAGTLQGRRERFETVSMENVSQMLESGRSLPESWHDEHCRRHSSVAITMFRSE